MRSFEVQLNHIFFIMLQINSADNIEEELLKAFNFKS